jgi:hypothetical protein
MTKSATDVMHEIMVSTVLDSIAALKTASKGLPNTLLRDLASIHANTTFDDLPKEVQAAVTSSVRGAFTRLQREGYIVSSGQPPAARPMRQGVPVGRDGKPLPPRRDGPTERRPPRNAGRPAGKPKPRNPR